MLGYAHAIPTGGTKTGYGFQNMEHRMFLGFYYEPSIPPRPTKADLDRDGDGILDVDDACPDVPETYNGFEDEDGCSDEGDVVVTGGGLQIMKKVYFEYNSDKIKHVSFRILDEVALTINNNPQISKLEAQGHADERGKDGYNLKLTIKRAAAVKKYLVKKGVDRSRLQSQGYGEYCPLIDESTEKAWDENRRVEFKVVEINGHPTGVKLGCPRSDAEGI